jgi:hypothetical protein
MQFSKQEPKEKKLSIVSTEESKKQVYSLNERHSERESSSNSSFKAPDLSILEDDEENEIPGYEILLNALATPFSYETGFYFKGKKTFHM